LLHNLEVRFAMIRMSCFRRWHRFYLGIAVACLACAPAWAQFETRAINPTAPYFGAFSVAEGDFNNDGKLDVAVTGDNGFTVWLVTVMELFGNPFSIPLSYLIRLPSPTLTVTGIWTSSWPILFPAL